MFKKYNHIMNKARKLAAVAASTAMVFVAANYVQGASTVPLDLTVVSSSQIKLVWEDSITGESSYRIDRKIDNGNFVEVAVLSANATVYNDYSLSTGRTYTYRVRWNNSSGATTVHTDEVAINTTVIAAPISLTVTPASSEGMSITWAYPESKGYETAIERRMNGSTAWETIATVPAGVNSYSDTSLKANTLYYYRIKSVYSSNIHSSTYPYDSSGRGAYTLLKEPTALNGYAASPTQIFLTWDDNSDETSFIVERKSRTQQNFTPIAYVSANTVSLLDWGLTPNTEYVYRLKAMTSNNASQYSGEITISSTYMEDPINFTATATSNSEIELQWADKSNAETGYEIWRKVGTGGSWENYALVGADVTGFKDKNLSADTLYSYKVRGYVAHSNIYSKFTREISAWTIPLKSPTDVQLTVLSTSQVKLNWTDNSSSESGFKVERKTGLDGEWKEIASLSANTTEYIDKGLTANTEYYYRIKVFDNAYYNSIAYSSEVDVVIGLPAAPADLRAEAVSSSQIRLVWSDKANNELGFKIERQKYGLNYKEIAQVSANVTTYLDSGLTPGTYYYRITAFNKTGNSVYCKEIRTATKLAVSFTDVPDNYWARNEIENLASRGVFKTKAPGIFRPDDKMTRGEFVSILAKAFKFNIIAVGSYKDVSQSHPYYKEIMIAAKAGIIKADKDNKFYPDRLITREDMALFIARTMQAASKPLPAFDISILDEYSDKGSVSTEALYSIASLCGEKVMEGKTYKGKRILAPKDNATRAEAAVMIYKVIDR
ncbi:MAG: S-layer homology domain-containing protein [Clostridia bacterium]|nr:S-layer homology domain-containing protein [Clostridia bacterium]